MDERKEKIQTRLLQLDLVSLVSKGECGFDVLNVKLMLIWWFGLVE